MQMISDPVRGCFWTRFHFNAILMNPRSLKMQFTPFLLWLCGVLGSELFSAFQLEKFIFAAIHQWFVLFLFFTSHVQCITMANFILYHYIIVVSSELDCRLMLCASFAIRQEKRWNYAFVAPFVLSLGVLSVSIINRPVSSCIEFCFIVYMFAFSECESLRSAVTKDFARSASNPIQT